MGRVSPVSAPRAKVLHFAVAFDIDGRVLLQGSPPLEIPAELRPEDLVLTGLVRCSLASLTYHARRAGVEARLVAAQASGTVTRREADGRYAFVDITCQLDVALNPAPQDLRALIAKAERDCFVGASLIASPRYRWRVNGADLPREPAA